MFVDLPELNSILSALLSIIESDAALKNNLPEDRITCGLIKL